jgi:uncharacterized protein
MTGISRFERNGVAGFLHEGAQPPHSAIVLTHGAGSDCSSPLLVATATAFADAGIWVLRCDLPFRQRRPSGPPWRAIAAEDRKGLRTAADQLREIAGESIYLAGHSYGGRQASILLAEEPETAIALMLLSYPLHPPQKPQELRTQHFQSLRKKTVFVHGTADPFGSIEEIARAQTLIQAPTHLIVVEGAAHDLKRGRLDFAPIVQAVKG